ncbi:MAG: hypothetical protein LUG57_10710 [Oscillospiraceae bacterium]|nr:hypothetical protein [Oscillospiraceae bacterium]
MPITYEHNLDLENDKVVIFADVVGFKNLIDFSVNDDVPSTGSVFQINLQCFSNSILNKYSREYQMSKNIHFMWVSDSIFMASNVDNITTLLEVFDDLANQLFCAHLVVRGGMKIGQLYWKDNLWGTDVNGAVELEKEAEYPRIIISKDDFDILRPPAHYKSCFRTCAEKKTEKYLYYDFFLSWFSRNFYNGNKCHSFFNIYISVLRDKYRTSTEDKHIRRWEWLGERLLETVDKFKDNIDAEHEAAKTQGDPTGRQSRSAEQYKKEIREILSVGHQYTDDGSYEEDD